MYKFVSFEELARLINTNEPLAFDTETLGLYGKVRLAQFYQKSWADVAIIDMYKHEQIELLVFMSQVNACIVMQNASYDVSTIQRNTNMRWVPKDFDDTLLLARLAMPTLESFSLDNLMAVALEFDPYANEGINKKDMHKADWTPKILTDKQLAYAAVDVKYLLDVYDKVSKYKDDISYRIDKLALSHALDFQCNGLPVLEEEVEKVYKANLAELEALDIDINVNSWQQVRAYLNCEKSDALTLSTMTLEGDERAGKILKAKRLKKQNSFLDKFLTEDGRIYGIFAPLAKSGRFTCKEQNLQQTPRAVKQVFGVKKDSGRCLLYADYPQLELRTIAAITNEQVLIKLFQEGKDPHNYVAEAIFGPNFTPEDRQVTKTYNFNLLYCGGANMIRSILITQANTLRDLDVIQRDKRSWKRAWPAIAAWQEEVVSSHRRGRLRNTPLGRRYLGKLITDHANIENQGFGADVAKLALHYMMPKLKEHDALLCNFVHDSFIVEMDSRDLNKCKKVAKAMQQAMIDAWTEACKVLSVKDIPMPAQVFCGYDLGSIEKDPIFKV